jgi:hypothetical protein
VEFAVHEWLQTKAPDFYRQGIFKLFPDGRDALVLGGIMLKNIDVCVE